MEIKFKKIEWIDRSADYSRTVLPFGIELVVRLKKNGKFRWAVGSFYSVFKSGYCKTMESARNSAEKAYQAYIRESLSFITEA
jgi:hypothetical protein